MAHEERTVFTCDRCGYVRSMPRSEQPTTWVSVRVVAPVKAAPENEKRRVDLCGDCADEFYRWCRRPAEAPS
jgi:hypothetical protein